MKHALIIPGEPRIHQVEAAPFPVAAPLAWIDCGDDVTPETHRLGAEGIEPIPAPEPPAPKPYDVSKLLIIERLIAADKFDAAMQAIGEPRQLPYERWQAATVIHSDDEEVRDLLLSIGADPDVILARE